jgi:hypothetical protein
LLGGSVFKPENTFNQFRDLLFWSLPITNSIIYLVNYLYIRFVKKPFEF